MSGYGTSSCLGSGGAQGKPRELLAPSLIPASLSACRRRKKRRVSETAQVAWPGLGSRDLISNSALEAKSQVSPLASLPAPVGRGDLRNPTACGMELGELGLLRNGQLHCVSHTCAQLRILTKKYASHVAVGGFFLLPNL